MGFSPGWLWFDALSRVVSPYVTNPLNRNPLVEVLDETVDFAWLREHHAVPLFVCATNVLTGRLRVFSGPEISAKSVMASACLPLMFQAVEIDGEHFWDGGFMGNPPLFPLIYETDCEDVLIVQINPVNIAKVPVSAQEITDRMNELSFNSSLMREMRAITFVQKLLAENRIPHGPLQGRARPRRRGRERDGGLGYSSKVNADADFLTGCSASGGRRRARSWTSTWTRSGGSRRSTWRRSSSEA
jgi:NTE family protein